MKNYLLFIFLFLVSIENFGQEINQMDIHSAHLNEVKVIQVFVPDGYKVLKKKYPLTIILDSDVLFDSYVASAKLFSNDKINPQQIIVSIKQFKNENRQKNYGYDNLNGFPNRNSLNMLNFIKLELLPTLKKKYKIANFKTIVGTELTANFINYFIFDKSPAFDAYVSINPELATDMPEHLKVYVPEIKGNDTYYYMAHGNQTLEKHKKLIDAADVGLANISNLYFNYKYENFSHSSTIVSIPQSLASAQEYIFSMYSPISDKEYEDNISFLSPEAAIEYLLYKYENIEYLFGEKIAIRLEDFVKLEPIIIDKNEGKKLKKYGELVLEIHPKSPLGNYYIGQYFEKRQEYSKALLSYKKGYAKIPQSSPKSYGYYMNIKRIISLQKLEKENANN